MYCLYTSCNLTKVWPHSDPSTCKNMSGYFLLFCTFPYQGPFLFLYLLMWLCELHVLNETFSKLIFTIFLQLEMFYISKAKLSLVSRFWLNGGGLFVRSDHMKAKLSSNFPSEFEVIIHTCITKFWEILVAQQFSSLQLWNRLEYFFKKVTLSTFMVTLFKFKWEL